MKALDLDLTDPAQRQFGDDELLKLIGEGGMGVVYRAHEKSLDREVAVKLLAAGPLASREFSELQQNAARMQHPNIVVIYEIRDAGELNFFGTRPSLVRIWQRSSSATARCRLSALHACRVKPIMR